MNIYIENKLPSAPTCLLILALIFGTCMALVVPPSQVPDEGNHFGRAFALSEGHWSPTTVMLPEGFLKIFAYTEMIINSITNKFLGF